MCEKTRQQKQAFFVLRANSCCADCIRLNVNGGLNKVSWKLILILKQGPIFCCPKPLPSLKFCKPCNNVRMCWIFMITVVLCLSTCHVSSHEVISPFLLAWSDLSCFPAKLASVCFLLLWSHRIHFFIFSWLIHPVSLPYWTVCNGQFFSLFFFFYNFLFNYYRTPEIK